MEHELTYDEYIAKPPEWKLEYYKATMRRETMLLDAAESLKCKPEEVVDKLKWMKSEIERMKKEIDEIKAKRTKKPE